MGGLLVLFLYVVNAGENFLAIRWARVTLAVAILGLNIVTGYWARSRSATPSSSASAPTPR